MVKCYTQYNDAIHEQSNWFPVGHSSNGNEFFPCCDEGDIGLDSSICQYSESSPGGSTYYVAGCTDPSYNASVCSEYCSEYQELDSRPKRHQFSPSANFHIFHLATPEEKENR